MLSVPATAIQRCPETRMYPVTFSFSQTVQASRTGSGQGEEGSAPEGDGVMGSGDTVGSHPYLSGGFPG